MRGSWREGSSTVDPKGYAQQSSGNGRLFPKDSRLWGTGRDAPFLGPLREGEKNFLFRGIFMRMR